MARLRRTAPAASAARGITLSATTRSLVASRATYTQDSGPRPASRSRWNWPPSSRSTIVSIAGGAATVPPIPSAATYRHSVRVLVSAEISATEHRGQVIRAITGVASCEQPSLSVARSGSLVRERPACDRHELPRVRSGVQRELQDAPRHGAQRVAVEGFEVRDGGRNLVVIRRSPTGPSHGPADAPLGIERA